LNINHFKLLAENSAQGIIISSEDGTIIYANNSACKLLNTSLETGFSLPSFLINDNIKMYQEVKKDDKVLSIIINKCTLDELPIRFWYISDITELYQLKKELHYLNIIINTINEGVTVVNTKGEIILYNNQAAHMEGLCPEQVIGKHINEVYNVVGGSAYLKVIKSKQPIGDTGFTYTTVNGDQIKLVGSMHPIIEDDKAIAAFCIFRNIDKINQLLIKTMELHEQLISSKEHKYNGTRFTFSDIIGESLAIKDTINRSIKASYSTSPVLIYGETGTGKELFAQSIHNKSSNNEQPFLAINCAAIPESLLESILFGTIKGAFTGAQNSIGLFEQAGKGTLFLDEINSMSTDLQAKLLRALQEKSIRRIGATNEIPINCRIISSTNADPEQCILKGTLRKDLYYRLAVICINIPPLRVRDKDIELLTHYFIKKFGRLYGKTNIQMSPQFENIIYKHTWPGNIRELEHVLESSITMLEDEEILNIYHLPPYLQSGTTQTSSIGDTLIKTTNFLTDELIATEKKVILSALQNHNWNITQAAKSIGISRTNLQYRMNKLKINKINNI
jgi:arginine utilization regulatory protein